MIAGVLVGSVLGMLVGAGCLIAGVPVLWSLGAWSVTGAMTVMLVAVLSLRPPRRAVQRVLRPQRA